jgi:hypothetical protein
MKEDKMINWLKELWYFQIWGLCPRCRNQVHQRYNTPYNCYCDCGWPNNLGTIGKTGKKEKLFIAKQRERYIWERADLRKDLKCLMSGRKTSGRVS